MVEIKGIEKFAPRDFPGHISSTVFLGGCNFRCPYCHNADLVLRPDALPTMRLDEFCTYLDGRKGWLEGVCVSGGEPLLAENLEDLLLAIKERALLVKLDTNGSLSGRLDELIRAGLLDQVALDVKAPLERYREVTGLQADPAPVSVSLDLLRRSGLECTFRTTVVPGLVGPEDVRRIAQMLRGARLYQLQPFFPRNTIDSRYLSVEPFSREEILAMADLARPFVREVRVEGV